MGDGELLSMFFSCFCVLCYWQHFTTGGVGFFYTKMHMKAMLLIHYVYTSADIEAMVVYWRIGA